MQEPAMPVQDATLVCVDLPGYGGSDSLKKYDTEVLEALTEFVVAMRDQYIPPDESETARTFIVGHDWGCVLGFRLAAEAACLADQFILTNAPHVSLSSHLISHGLLRSKSLDRLSLPLQTKPESCNLLQRSSGSSVSLRDNILRVCQSRSRP